MQKFAPVPRTILLAALRALCLAQLVLLAAITGAQAQEEGSLKIVPVFGAERMDITGDVYWFGSDIGTIESERRSDAGDLWGYNFAERVRSLGEDGVYPPATAEVGVALNLEGFIHLGRYPAPVAVDGVQVLEVPITGAGRIVVEADGLEDNALMELMIDGPGGSTTGTTGWRNMRGAHYRMPGNFTVRLTNKDTGASQTQQVSMGEGQSATVSFDF